MNSSQRSAASGVADDLSRIWANGYSIPELWGFTKPFSSSEPSSDKTHILLWGILSIVEYQLDKGAGHKYLRDRLWNRDWIAIGFPEPKTPDSKLQILPPIENAKFGRQHSAVGDGVTNYTDVRIVSRSRLSNVGHLVGSVVGIHSHP
jgi:hypothetical protein